MGEGQLTSFSVACGTRERGLWMWERLGGVGRKAGDVSQVAASAELSRRGKGKRVTLLLTHRSCMAFRGPGEGNRGKQALDSRWGDQVAVPPSRAGKS